MGTPIRRSRMADITGLTNSRQIMFEESAPGFGSELLFSDLFLSIR
jgi:hypothetical protein